MLIMMCSILEQGNRMYNSTQARPQHIYKRPQYLVGTEKWMNKMLVTVSFSVFDEVGYSEKIFETFSETKPSDVIRALGE